VQNRTLQHEIQSRKKTIIAIEGKTGFMEDGRRKSSKQAFVGLLYFWRCGHMG
jgi:hypothetical protein